MPLDPIRIAQLLGGAMSPQQVTPANPAALSGPSFGDTLMQSLSDIAKTQSAVQSDAVALATGKSDALHNITINAAKADLAITTVVSLRNKALEAYNEIMRITL
ncbi:flagellar hook-basal body complex protein FliE [Bacillota bacterium Meth-B3]